MKIQNGLLSVIIPTYNRVSMLIEAIESIRRQTYSNYEIIIVDDCSSDNTQETIKNMYATQSNIKYYKNEVNSGAGISRKNGYSKSNGDYIIFCDDDDYYTDYSFFERAIRIMEETDNISFVGANSKIKYEDSGEFTYEPLNISGKIHYKEYLDNFQVKYKKPNSTFTAVFNRNCLEKADFSKMEMMNDSSIYLRALLITDAFILDDIVGVYRIHNKNISFSLDSEFLIENLKEKKYIYNIILENNILENADKWWYEQILLTTRYYILYSKPNFKQFYLLLNWCVENGERVSEKIFRELSILYIEKNS